MFSFPNPLNEKAARVVGGVVAIAGVVILVTAARWLLIPLAYGFWARVLTGPRLSPLGRLASGVIALGFGAHTAADVLTGALVVAATLESVFALCLGCQAFALLMRAGLVPEETCERCANIWSQPQGSRP
jgi:hypothetical protein